MLKICSCLDGYSVGRVGKGAPLLEFIFLKTAAVMLASNVHASIDPIDSIESCTNRRLRFAELKGRFAIGSSVFPCSLAHVDHDMYLMAGRVKKYSSNNTPKTSRRQKL